MEPISLHYEKFMSADDTADAGAIRELLWKILDGLGQLTPQEVLSIHVEGFTRMWHRFPESRHEECQRVARHHLQFLEQDFHRHGVKGEHVEMARQNANGIRSNWQFLQNGGQLIEKLSPLLLLPK